MCPYSGARSRDRLKSSLSETAPAYLFHVVIATGRSDWSSKVENESAPALSLNQNDASKLPNGPARMLKNALGRQGSFFDVSGGTDPTSGSQRLTTVTAREIVLVTNFGLQSSEAGGDTDQMSIAAQNFPAGMEVTGIPDTDAGHAALVRSFIRNSTQARASDQLSRTAGSALNSR